MEDAFTDVVAEAFRKFVNNANVQILHDLDERRFNEFVLLSYRQGNKVSEDYLRGQLEEFAFDDYHVRVLSEHYDLSFDLLRQAEGLSPV